ncbi:hypothetical protein GDO78_004612 [Eleutherodactylus coqui]|uniref:RING-type E3 ubiquitin transferase n=3 Tax=Eleutherodactylus coqui TaxID=57060 RepID=A0A8J6ET89_ELECQ|nr:hypothetical protein GDO78_004612 [Eleutherodactylus coqui]
MTLPRPPLPRHMTLRRWAGKHFHTIFRCATAEDSVNGRLPLTANRACRGTEPCWRAEAGTQQLLEVPGWRIGHLHCLELKPVMDKNWDKHKSIVNGHHMKGVQQRMDSEYRAHLRYQEQVRENTERLREKRASSQRTPNLLNIYSTQSYSKPWQKGMSTETEIQAVSRLEERQTPRKQYKSTVSKLPAIKKDKDIIMSQPRITVEKKRLHVHQLSARPRVTRVTGDTAKNKITLKLQSKAKESKRPAKHQKQILKEKASTNGAINDLTSTQQPYVEQKTVLGYDADHHDPAMSPPSNSHEFTEEPQTTRRPLSSSQSQLREPEDVLNGQPERNVNEGDYTNVEDHLSYVSDSTLTLPVATRAQMYNPSLHIGGSDSTDSEEDGIDSDNEEHSEDEEVNSHSTLHDLGVGTGNNSYFERTNRGPQQTSRPPVTETADQSPNSNPNLRHTSEVPRIDASIALSRNHEISANANMQNHGYHALPLTTFRDTAGRETDRLGQLSAAPNPLAPPRLSMSSTAPNIALLRENLDLVFHTLSMQRQSERRNVENTVLTSQNNKAEKQKADPEKLKKLRESLLQEESEEEEDLCRICLMGGEATDLIAPCQCAGSLKHVHTECMKRWLLAKIKSGADLNTVVTCEMCRQKVECEIEGFNLMEHYRKHQETQATLNPSLYLALLLHLYQQRYEELLQLSHTRDRVSEISRRFVHLSLGRHDQPRDNQQDS